MALTFRSSDYANPGSSKTLTVTKPAGTAAGDLLVAVVQGGGENYAAPAGWTVMQALDLSMFCYKIAGGSEPASYVWGTNLNFYSWAGGIACFTNVDNHTPLGASGINSAAGSAAAYPSVAVRGGALVVACCTATFNSGNGIGDPSGYTVPFDIASPGAEEAQLAYKLNAATGAQQPPQPGIGGSIASSYTYTAWFYQIDQKQNVL